MTSTMAAALSLLLLLPVLFSQTPPGPQPQQPQPQPPPAAQDEEILRVDTELVQTDVTVLDKQGRFVNGLRREQFELFVDGKPQPISFFEQLVAGGNREAALLAAGRAGAPGAGNDARAATSAAAERGRTTLFFVDDMHLAAGSMSRTRDMLLRFVDSTMGPKDQAVIATASGQLGFLQQVTGDKEVLRAAVRRLTFRQHSTADNLSDPRINEYQAIAIERNDPDVVSFFIDMQCEEFKKQGRACGGPTNSFSSPGAVLDEGYARPRGGGSGNSNSSVSTAPIRAQRAAGGGAANTVRMEAERMIRNRARIVARQAAQVTLNMLYSLESLIRTAAPIPERKLVVFISDGFYINYLNSTNAYDLRRVADAALRSGTVIYTVDARGLTSGNWDASQKGGFDPQGRTTRMSLAEVTAAQDPLNSLAADTGGRAFFNSNDMDRGVAQAISETSVYYLLAWRPEPGSEGKDRFRRIEVKVKDRPDVTVRVRRGFFAEDPAAAAGGAAAGAPAAAAAGKPKTVEEELLAVVRAAYPRRSLPTAVSAGHMFTPAGGMTVAASMLVDAAALGADAKAAEADVMGVLVNDKGDVVSSLLQHLTAAAVAAQRGRMIYTMQFPNLAPGLYQVRVAARDPKTGRTGSASQWLEVPDAAKADFALSSVFLTELPADAAAARKAAVSPDGRFARTSRLRIQSQVFNAARGASAPDLTLALQLSSGGRAVVATPPSPVATQGVADLTRIPLSAEFPLGGFPPGRYELKLTITDRVARKSVTRQSEFTVE